MRETGIRPIGAVRPKDPSTSAEHAGDDACGFQPSVSGDGRGAVRPQFARMDGLVPAPGRANENTGTIPGGGQYPSRPWRSDGGAVRPLGGGLSDVGPRFNQPVANNGYAWWYVDAVSDDGQNAITIIAFIGSVFSPYYAFARRGGRADPLNHCAINVVLYRKRGKQWAMTERPSRAVDRAANFFNVGPSHVAWDGKALAIHIDEIAVPIPGRIRGTIRLVPAAITRQAFTLNDNGGHQWWPIAPCARVQVMLDRPHLRWQGDGYFDMNRGDAPLEQGFAKWQWARGTLNGGGAIILYEALRRDGSRADLAVTIDAQGQVQPFEPPPMVELKRTGWRVGRQVRSEDGAAVVRTLEDAPFYARSLVSAKLLGEPVTLMHESLSLDRFRMPLVQAMLPFRMPRIWW